LETRRWPVAALIAVDGLPQPWRPIVVEWLKGEA